MIIVIALLVSLIVIGVIVHLFTADNSAEIYDQRGICADCGCPIGHDNGPPDGWTMEDGRIICHECCVEDTKNIMDL